MKNIIVTIGILMSAQAYAANQIKTWEVEAGVSILRDLRCTTFARRTDEPITELGNQLQQTDTDILWNSPKDLLPSLEHKYFHAEGCEMSDLAALGKKARQRFGLLDGVRVTIKQELIEIGGFIPGECNLVLNETVTLYLGEEVQGKIIVTSSARKEMGPCPNN